MYKEMKRVDGFTLLELIIIMGIVGMLTATSMLYFMDKSCLLYSIYFLLNILSKGVIVEAGALNAWLCIIHN